MGTLSEKKYYLRTHGSCVCVWMYMYNMSGDAPRESHRNDPDKGEEHFSLQFASRCHRLTRLPHYHSPWELQSASLY